MESTTTKRKRRTFRDGVGRRGNGWAYIINLPTGQPGKYRHQWSRQFPTKDEAKGCVVESDGSSPKWHCNACSFRW